MTVIMTVIILTSFLISLVKLLLELEDEDFAALTRTYELTAIEI